MMPDRLEERSSPYSAELRERLSNVLIANAALREHGVNAQLHDVVADACAETHAKELTTVQMVIELKALYASLPPVSFGSEAQRREVFDRFLSACIVQWFEDGTTDNH
ncbi:MAG: hypothetical protein JWM95_955 [Gemmatimonadetes bacterium]|nr:hypothetical protein [Gemmatimonadota bacterium]